MLAPGTVVDADPRTISNLIADQTLNNPAAISAALTYAGITGAAQMTAISQIQAARAAIVQAQSSAGATPEQLAALQTAVDTAEAALTQAQADLMQPHRARPPRTRVHMQPPWRTSPPRSRPSSNAQAVSNAMGANLLAAGNHLAAVQQTLSQGQAAVDAALAQVNLSAAAVATAQAAVTAATATLTNGTIRSHCRHRRRLLPTRLPWSRPSRNSSQANQDLAAQQASLDDLIANGAGDQSEAIALAEAAVDAAMLAVSQKQADVAYRADPGRRLVCGCHCRTGCRDGCIRCAGDGRGRARTASAGCCGRSGRSSGGSCGSRRVPAGARR